MELEHKIVHFLYTPFTGLGLYNGYRGDRWLRNRIMIFKQFVVPYLTKQWHDNMVLWISWRPEELTNPQVACLKRELDVILKNRVIFTYSGVNFWDDKYPDSEAKVRLRGSLGASLCLLAPLVCGAEEVWMTIQPSDDIYLKMPRGNQGWAKGYIMNYLTGEIADYDPTTTPPFYTIAFKPEVFLDPDAHMKYTGPYKSHEYVKDFIPMEYLDERGFIVGVHGENISTGWDIPFKGKAVNLDFGFTPIKINRGCLRVLFFRLPHWVRRKLRYIFSEKFYAKIHKYVTNH